MIGHNNEKLQGMTPQQCEVACCARSWCRSFDYIASLAGGTCNLADVDSRTNMASTVQNRGNVLYERPVRHRDPIRQLACLLSTMKTLNHAPI